MPYTPTVATPDAEALVIDILKLGGIPRASTSAPANLETILPYVVVYKIGGGSKHIRLSDRAEIRMQCYGASRETAYELAETCRTLLFDAWKTQLTNGEAVIARYDETLAPVEIRIPELPDRTWRFDATYSLRVRKI